MKKLVEKKNIIVSVRLFDNENFFVANGTYSRERLRPIRKTAGESERHLRFHEAAAIDIGRVGKIHSGVHRTATR